MVFIFWSSLAFLLYTFILYPLLLCLVSIFRTRLPQRAAICPSVSVIVAVHNEAAVIREKINNCLDLDYPVNKREIIVASDGSTDGTADIVRSFADRGVKLVELLEKRGKHFAQMMARDVSTGEILVFTDASIHVEPSGLRRIVSNFADPMVGCVSSEDRSVTEGKSWKSERFYVRAEMWLRRLESKIGSLVSASGSLFAVRRELCEDWHAGQSSDFFLVLHTVARGLRSVVDPECLARVGLVRSERAELQRKIRTIVHGLDVFFTHLEFANPIRYGLFSWQLISHKLFRWLVPFPILLLLVSNLWLWKAGVFYQVSLALQAGLYLCGGLALVSGGRLNLKPLKLAGFFLLGNLAIIIAWLKFGAKEKYASWEPSRRS